MEEKLIGKISHFFNKIGVGIIELSDNLKVGDKIHIKGHVTNFEQTVSSMQIEHQEVPEAKKGEGVGIKVDQLVREHDEVYKIVEE